MYGALGINGDEAGAEAAHGGQQQEDANDAGQQQSPRRKQGIVDHCAQWIVGKEMWLRAAEGGVGQKPQRAENHRYVERNQGRVGHHPEDGGGVVLRLGGWSSQERVGRVRHRSQSGRLHVATARALRCVGQQQNDEERKKGKGETGKFAHGDLMFAWDGRGGLALRHASSVSPATHAAKLKACALANTSPI